jgi:hypothetical protein
VDLRTSKQLDGEGLGAGQKLGGPGGLSRAAPPESPLPPSCLWPFDASLTTDFKQAALCLPAALLAIIRALGPSCLTPCSLPVLVLLLSPFLSLSLSLFFLVL